MSGPEPSLFEIAEAYLVHCRQEVESFWKLRDADLAEQWEARANDIEAVLKRYESHPFQLTVERGTDGRSVVHINLNGDADPAEVRVWLDDTLLHGTAPEVEG